MAEVEYASVPVYVIDGNDFDTLDGFYDAVGGVLALGQAWGRNLDAFNDILCWPKVKPYDLVWRHHRRSRPLLNYSARADEWERIRRGTGPATNLSRNPALDRWYQAHIDRASRAEGPSLFDLLVDIVRGDRNRPYVTLRLE
jgi:RNAse (barnase) inhibitor barstar